MIYKTIGSIFFTKFSLSLLIQIKKLIKHTKYNIIYIYKYIYCTLSNIIIAIYNNIFILLNSHFFVAAFVAFWLFFCLKFPLMNTLIPIIGINWFLFTICPCYSVVVHITIKTMRKLDTTKLNIIITIILSLIIGTCIVYINSLEINRLDVLEYTGIIYVINLLGLSDMLGKWIILLMNPWSGGPSGGNPGPSGGNPGPGGRPPQGPNQWTHPIPSNSNDNSNDPNNYNDIAVMPTLDREFLETAPGTTEGMQAYRQGLIEAATISIPGWNNILEKAAIEVLDKREKLAIRTLQSVHRMPIIFTGLLENLTNNNDTDFIDGTLRNFWALDIIKRTNGLGNKWLHHIDNMHLNTRYKNQLERVTLQEEVRKLTVEAKNINVRVN